MIIPEGYYEATIKFTGPQAPRGAAVIMGGRNIADLSASDLAIQFRQTVVAHLKPQLNLSINYAGVRIKLGPNEDGPIADDAVGAGPGPIGTNPTTPVLAALVTKNTASGGRRGKGRAFFPGMVGEADVDASGVVTAARVTSLQTSFNAWWQDLTDDAIPPYLLHDHSYDWVIEGGQPKRVPNDDPVPAPTLIESFSVASVVATQRRRQRG